jgi:Holliday junction resolvasome RuvABC endonuclease subunit
MPHILGVDTGFRNFGIAKLQFNSKGQLELLGAEVIKTEKSAKKQETLASSDNLRRVAELTEAVAAWFDEELLAVCCEAMSLPRQASVSCKIGLAFGVLGALAQQHGVPIIQVSPQNLKLAVAGSKSATKEEIIAAVGKQFPTTPWPRATGLHEHMADAVGAVLACQQHPTILAVKKFSRKEKP